MSSDRTFLDAAAAIGRRVVADAVWHNGRCAWMGAVADPAAPDRPEHRALGPDLYDGTAGVGLFLAQLADLTGEAPARRTAIGALRHATARAAELPAARRDGFHAGVLGIAWAASRAGQLLSNEELQVLARSLLPDAGACEHADRSPDLLTGAAGRIVGLLGLSATLGEPRLVEDALADGEQLLEAATVTRYGWSWSDLSARHPNALCGVSHGAAGIGWALLELFTATGDDRFRAAASGAFAYERSWLDPSARAWPDLRIAGQRRGVSCGIESPAAGTWCHGEVGIALSRLRAIAVLGPGPHADDAEVALEVTRRLLDAALPYDIRDLTPCHGLAGAADALLCAADTLDDRWLAAADLATALGHTALDRYDPERGRWPCGIEGGSTPGLFLGLSGIGWLFLRLHDRATDSVLELHIHS